MMTILVRLGQKVNVTQFLFKKSNQVHSSLSEIPYGPFNSSLQRRWKKLQETAKTRMQEQRTRDHKLDKLVLRLRQLNRALSLQQIMSTRKRGPYVSLQIISRWKNVLSLNIPPGSFIRKYPHIFEVFALPPRRNMCCKVTKKMRDLIREEESIVRELELENVVRLKKILMMSVNGKLNIHALRLSRRELGLPIDFRESILSKYSDDFVLIDLETVGLVESDKKGLRGVAEVEKWREKEFREKWLSEFETKYSFPINFPTGFSFEPGFRERLKNWQRLPYVKPYDRTESVRIRTNKGNDQFEKRVVGVLHEFLCLTVSKMIEVQQLVHFRKGLGIEVNLREVILKHPGIFYISTKGNAETVFLREGYIGWCLAEPNSVDTARRKMLELILLGVRNTKQLRTRTENEIIIDQNELENEENVNTNETENDWGTYAGGWAIPILDTFDANE
ncbi:protein ROOT PRIMORDIUM DEFECTIVE 1 [Impatiens glandulifera]|uniref:protein ROOT PRIMORDIUM DEFECTIVE 1 n=1 Tax=Impatiens glandulifera TaxID=253017 RepID=UPI001FB10766|nr:protein ROOT PRIMORDIUM DEFECTIVE 1 [Impatiens glandulifera]